MHRQLGHFMIDHPLAVSLSSARLVEVPMGGYTWMRTVETCQSRGVLAMPWRHHDAFDAAQVR